MKYNTYLIKSDRQVVGERIRKLRKTYGFSQKQISEYLGITQGQLSKLEQGIRKIKPEQVNKLCKLYNTTPQWILEGDGEMVGYGVRITRPKQVNLDDLVRMNKIIRNIIFLDNLVE